MVHPASFTCLTAISDLPFNSGIIFAVVASFGSNDQLILPTSEEAILLPLGMVTFTGFRSFFMSVKGAYGVIKCPVAPESSIL